MAKSTRQYVFEGMELLPSALIPFVEKRLETSLKGVRAEHRFGTGAEYEQLLGPVPRLPSRGMGHGAEPPLLPPTGRHAAKRRGS